MGAAQQAAAGSVPGASAAAVSDSAGRAAAAELALASCRNSGLAAAAWLPHASGICCRHRRRRRAQQQTQQQRGQAVPTPPWQQQQQACPAAMRRLLRQCPAPPSRALRRLQSRALTPPPPSIAQRPSTALPSPLPRPRATGEGRAPASPCAGGVGGCSSRGAWGSAGYSRACGSRFGCSKRRRRVEREQGQQWWWHRRRRLPQRHQAAAPSAGLRLPSGRLGGHCCGCRRYRCLCWCPPCGGGRLRQRQRVWQQAQLRIHQCPQRSSTAAGPCWAHVLHRRHPATVMLARAQRRTAGGGSVHRVGLAPSVGAMQPIAAAGSLPAVRRCMMIDQSRRRPRGRRPW
jgi:hypothetical protein